MKIKITPFVYPDKITVVQSAFVKVGKTEYEAVVESEYMVPENGSNMEEFHRTGITLISLDMPTPTSLSATDYYAVSDVIVKDAEEWTPLKLNAKPTWPDSQDLLIKALAKKFSKVLKKWLGKKKMAIVVSRNKEANDSCCASHDFCDANMAMDEAFTKVMGRTFDFNFEETTEGGMQNSKDTDLMNAAWSMAKSNDFYINQ